MIYVDAAQGYSSADIGATLLHSLADRFKFTLARLDSEYGAIERIATDARNIGLFQRDFYVQYLRDHPGSDTRYEFYGDIPVCALAVVRKGSQIQSFGDLVKVRVNRPTTLDVGPASGQLAATFGNLRQFDRALASLQVEHLGGARALGQVMSGEIDAALFLVLPPYSGGLVFDLIDSGALSPVPFFSQDFVVGAAERGLPYVLRQIAIGTPGWFSSGRPYHTTCTSIGAVVNASGDKSMSEKIAQTLLEEGATPREGPWYAAVGRAFVVAFDEVHRLLIGAGEVITAWFNPASPGEAVAAAPAPKPELEPARHAVSER